MATIKELKTKAKKTEIETIPLTPTEIKLITDLNYSKQIVVNEFASIGQLEAGLDIRKRKNNTVFEKNLESERQLSKTLTDKYGEGTVDIDNQVFIPFKG
jgi:hypothetical protein